MPFKAFFIGSLIVGTGATRSGISIGRANCKQTLSREKIFKKKISGLARANPGCVLAPSLAAREEELCSTEKMGSQAINPNWAQLQQKLKIQGPRFKRPSIHSEEKTQKGVLGKPKERSNEETDDGSPAASILTPANDNISLTDTIAMDCEMVGVGSEGNKSALGHVTLVNAWGNIVYDEFVRPVEHVVDFRTSISGIRPRDMRKAKDFGVVQKKVAELTNGRILVGHALHNDFKALLLRHPKKDIRDTSAYRIFLKEGCSRSLKSLAAEFLGAKIQHGEHCPVEDARAAMLLYQKNKKVWERSIEVQLKFKETHKKRRPKKKKTLKDGVAKDQRVAPT